MVQESTRYHQIVMRWFDLALQNVELTNFQARRLQTRDATDLEIAGNNLAIGSDLSSHPLGYRAITTAHFQAAPSRLQPKPLEMASLQRIEEFRHQSKPLLLAGQRVGQNVCIHRYGLTKIEETRLGTIRDLVYPSPSGGRQFQAKAGGERFGRVAMRKVILGAGISLDGYIARRDGGIDFLHQPKQVIR